MPLRTHPVLAWLVILSVVAFIAWRAAVGSPEGRERFDLAAMELQGRLLVGMKSLLRQKGSESAEAVQRLERGTFAQRLRYVCLLAELAGPEKAREALARLRALWQEREVTPPPDEDAAADILARLLHDPPESLSDVDRAALVRELGWFGELVLAAEGADPASRAAVIQPARRAAMVLLSVVVLMGLAAIAGLAILVGVLVAWLLGRLPGPAWQVSDHGGVYAEAFALWLLYLLGVRLILRVLMPEGQPSLALGSVVMLTSLVVLAWPRLRGVPWPQIRVDLGLKAGPWPLGELLIGATAYLAALPLVILAALAITWLTTLKERLGFPDDPFGPSSNPGHPILDEILHGSWSLRLQTLFAAVIVAPLVEETVFRGLLYRHLRDASAAWGRSASVVFSLLVVSFLFAAIHPQGMLAVPALMTLAGVFTLAREWRDSLLPAMAAHALNNGVLTALMLAIAS